LHRARARLRRLQRDPTRRRRFNDPSGPVYYAPDSGTIQTDGSILVSSPIVNTPGDRGILGGGSFVAPQACCQTLPGGTSPLTTPAVLDVSGLTLPLHPALQ
jgi:hypothetical protein